MIKIRLSRGGVKRKPFYRVVVTDERNKNRGKYLEFLGYWQPAKNIVNLKKEAIAKWVELGAKITPAVAKLLKTK